MKFVVAIGSNLEDGHGHSPHALCKWAVAELEKNNRIKVDMVSHWYQTAPVPASDQPDYINGAVKISTDYTSDELLDVLQDIEACAGRVRKYRNEARVLDLDILTCEDQVIMRDHLIVPHPRLIERAFALYPLLDVDPSWVDPRSKKNMHELMKAVRGQSIQRLSE